MSSFRQDFCDINPTGVLFVGGMENAVFWDRVFCDEDCVRTEVIAGGVNTKTLACLVSGLTTVN